MPVYKAPVQDISFLLKDVLNAPERTKDIPGYAQNDWEMSKMFLESVAEFAETKAFPLNHKADQEGCTFDPKDHSVKTPAGFKQAYDEFCNLGIIGLTGAEADNGLGQSHYLSIAANEMLTAANFSLTTYGGLTGGAAKVIARFGSEDIKKLYLSKMYTGEWTGTMCLTEPDAGSDLGGVATKAEPQTDGSFKISGNKIFITSGEHDLADNICHLVLARLPGAPSGTKGISLFLVPKKQHDAAGNLGESNGVSCTGIVHKMGIHASSTCSMSFEGSTGYLIGNPNEGLKAMFTMMNDARMGVTSQGIGIADAATQNAIDYSTVRVQGKALKDSFNESAKSVTIIHHANVRKDLVEMTAQVQGYRALELEAAINLDIAEHHPDPAKRHAAEQVVSLLTPVLKANATDLACALSQKAIQLHGGMGFITEMGIEQYYRDSIIGTIYEGTNDIQSMDFTLRKALKPNKTERAANENKPKSDAPKAPRSAIPTKGLAGFFARTKLGRNMIEKKIGDKLDPLRPGTPLSAFGLQAMEDIKTAAKNPELKAHAKAVEAAMADFSRTVRKMGMLGAEGRVEDVLIHSRDFMDMFGKVAVGCMWLKMMNTSQALSATATDPTLKEFYDTKIQLGDTFIHRVMAPQVKALEIRINSNTGPIHKLGENQLRA